jgi:UPF0271 protein
VSRGRADALLTDPAVAAERVVRMVREGRARTVDGKDIEIVAETICIHGDGAHAVQFARTLRAALDTAGVRVAAPSSSS